MKLLNEIVNLLRNLVTQNDEIIELLKTRNKEDKYEKYKDPATGLYRKVSR